MKFKKFMAFGISAVMAFAALTGCSGQTTTTTTDTESETVSESSSEDNVITMATNAAFEPFEYVDDNNNIVGYDIVVADKIAESLGKELEIQNIDFDALIPALSSGIADFVIAGMTVTEERQANVLFSDPYFEASQVIIVKDGDTAITGADSLAGAKVAVQEGTTGDIYVTDELGVQTVSRFKKAVDCVQDLLAGGSDAVVIDNQVAQNLVESTEGLVILPEVLTTEEYAIAVDKENTELQTQINEVLQQLEADGTLDKARQAYIEGDEAVQAELEADLSTVAE